MMLTDSHRLRIEVGAELARGGEGSVHEVIGHASLLAKLYFSPPDPKKLAKIQFQCSSSDSELRRVAAWPQSVLFRDGAAAELHRRARTRR